MNGSLEMISTPYQKRLLDYLLEHGAKVSILDKTDIIVVNWKSRNLFFIGEYMPLNPHSIGMILTSKNLTNLLLRSKGILIEDPFVYKGQKKLLDDFSMISLPANLSYEDCYHPLDNFVIKSKRGLIQFLKKNLSTQRLLISKNWLNKLSIYYDKDGFLNVLIKNSGKIEDVTDKIDKVVVKIAQQVLDCFAPSMQICFTLNTNELFINIEKSYAIETVFPSVGFHYNFWASSKDQKKLVIERTMEILTEKCLHFDLNHDIS